VEHGNGRNGAPRPEAQLTGVWNPNTGKLDLKAVNLNPMEQLGLCFAMALELYTQAKQPAQMPRIVEAAGPLTPHLKH
jgi:hypothetical protein